MRYRGCAGRHRTRLRCRSAKVSQGPEGFADGTNIVLRKVWKHLEKFLEECHEIVGHLVKLVDVAIGVDIAETCSDGIVDEQKIRKFVPRPFVESQSAVLVYSVWPNFH